MRSVLRAPSVAIEPLEGRCFFHAGDLVPTFGNGGKVVTHFKPGEPSEALALFSLSSGKLLAAGLTAISSAKSDLALARYNGNGKPDKTFGVNGKIITHLALSPYTHVD